MLETLAPSLGVNADDLQQSDHERLLIQTVLLKRGSQLCSICTKNLRHSPRRLEFSESVRARISFRS